MKKLTINDKTTPQIYLTNYWVFLENLNLKNLCADRNQDTYSFSKKILLYLSNNGQKCINEKDKIQNLPYQYRKFVRILFPRLIRYMIRVDGFNSNLLWHLR